MTTGTLHNKTKARVVAIILDNNFFIAISFLLRLTAILVEYIQTSRKDCLCVPCYCVDGIVAELACFDFPRYGKVFYVLLLQAFLFHMKLMGVTMNLKIQHKPQSGNSYSFKIQCPSRGVFGHTITLPSPSQYIVPQHKKPLQAALAWYLESFPQNTMSPNSETAVNTISALKAWGRECFAAIFNLDIIMQKMHAAAIDGGADCLRIEVISNDPGVLSWPWEAVYSDADGFLVQWAVVSRQLASGGRVLSAAASKQLNILYILSRAATQDVGNYILARPLIECIAEGDWPVNIDILRPPTMERLAEVLSQNSGYYHILHFDGHGSASDKGSYLYFNDGAMKGIKAVASQDFADLVSKHNIPYVVLNACRSAMHTGNTYAPLEHLPSTAISLLSAGVCGVVAMGYKLQVASAEIFVSSFYRHLFEYADFGTAVAAAQRDMISDNKRLDSNSEYHDWLIPVLYKTDNAAALPQILPAKERAGVILPGNVSIDNLQNPCIIKDNDISRLEQSIMAPHPAILIHGMAGAGKTTLARGFVQWLKATNSPFQKHIQVNLNNQNSAAHVIDTMTLELIGTSAIDTNTKKQSQQDKLEALTHALTATPTLVVWDSYESSYKYEDRYILFMLLKQLSNTHSKILITSRTYEDRFAEGAIGLTGCKMEYLTQELEESLATFAKNTEAAPILRLLGLHENCIKANLLTQMLKPVQGQHVNKVISSLSHAGLCHNDKASRGDIYQLHPALCPWLRRYYPAAETEKALFTLVFATFAEEMQDEILTHTPNRTLAMFEPNLRSALGFAKELEMDKSIVVLLKIIAGYASSWQHADEAKERLQTSMQFIEEADIASHFHLLNMAVRAQNQGDYPKAELHVQQAIEQAKKADCDEGLSKAYEQLGDLLQQQNKFDEAYKMYQAALPHTAKNLSQASILHQMGFIEMQKWNFDAAIRHYEDALQIHNNLGGHGEHSKAALMSDMGLVLCQQGQYSAAKAKFLEARDIFQRYNDDNELAELYHKQAHMYVTMADYDSAETTLNAALKLSSSQHVTINHCLTYLQLSNAKGFGGKDTVAGEKWARKALETLDELESESFTASSDIYISAAEGYKATQDGYNCAAKRYKSSATGPIRECLNEMLTSFANIKKIGALGHDKQFEYCMDVYNSLNTYSMAKREVAKTEIYNILHTMAEEGYEKAEPWLETIRRL